MLISPADLLKAIREAGFTVRTNGYSLEVNDACLIDAGMAALIRRHKEGLINLLKHEAEHGQ